MIVGAIGWPLLTFYLCRYPFRLSDQWASRCAILAFGVAGCVGIGFGDSSISLERAGRSTTMLFTIRNIVFAFPYAALALWLALRAFLRLRHERSTPTI